MLYLLQTTVPTVAINPETASVFNGPNGLALIIVIGIIGIAAVIALFILLWHKKVKVPGIKPNGPDSPDTGERRQNSQGVNVTVTTPPQQLPQNTVQTILEQHIQMTAGSFQTLLSAINSASNDHEERREELKSKLNRIMISEQDDCIRKVIQTLSIEYNGKVDEKENLDESTKILDLYLQRDLNRIIKEEFKNVRDNNQFGAYTPEQTSDKIGQITENVVREMKIAIREYIIINKEIFTKLFDNQIILLKENVSSVLKRYISSSRDTQGELDKAMEEKVCMLEKRLKAYIEVI